MGCRIRPSDLRLERFLEQGAIYYLAARAWGETFFTRFWKPHDQKKRGSQVLRNVEVLES